MIYMISLALLRRRKSDRLDLMVVIAIRVFFNEANDKLCKSLVLDTSSGVGLQGLLSGAGADEAESMGRGTYLP